MGALSAAGGFSTAAGTSAPLRTVFARAAIGRLAELARSDGDPKTKRVLALDAGTGILVGQLARAGLNCWALDPQQNLALQIRRSLPQVAVGCASMTALAAQTGPIDLVCVGALEEQPEPELVLAEARRVLRPGAVCAQVVNRVDLSVAWIRDLSELGAIDCDARLGAGVFAATLEGFSDLTEESFANPFRTSVDVELDRAGSTARRLAMSEAEQRALLATAKELLAAHTESTDSTGALEFPQNTVLRYWRAV